MASDVLIVCYVLGGAAAAVGVGFTFQPLTKPAGTGRFADNLAIAEVQAEKSYCQSALSGVNCICFSKTSVALKPSDSARVRGFAYADPKSLVRHQAAQKC